MTKLLVEPETQKVLGAGIVGVGAGDLISETVLALEMGADAQDIALTVHPHPTLSETVAFSAEMVDGSITDLMPPRRRARSSLTTPRSQRALPMARIVGRSSADHSHERRQGDEMAAIDRRRFLQLAGGTIAATMLSDSIARAARSRPTGRRRAFRTSSTSSC